MAITIEQLPDQTPSPVASASLRRENPSLQLPKHYSPIVCLTLLLELVQLPGCLFWQICNSTSISEVKEERGGREKDVKIKLMGDVLFIFLLIPPSDLSTTHSNVKCIPRVRGVIFIEHHKFLQPTLLNRYQ